MEGQTLSLPAARCLSPPDTRLLHHGGKPWQPPLLPSLGHSTHGCTPKPVPTLCSRGGRAPRAAMGEGPYPLAPASPPAGVALGRSLCAAPKSPPDPLPPPNSPTRLLCQPPLWVPLTVHPGQALRVSGCPSASPPAPFVQPSRSTTMLNPKPSRSRAGWNQGAKSMLRVDQAIQVGGMPLSAQAAGGYQQHPAALPPVSCLQQPRARRALFILH